MSLVPLKDSSMDSIPIALGNPAYSHELRERERGSEGDLLLGRSFFDPPEVVPGKSEIANDGITTFWYKTDQDRYDSGYLIIVAYKWNDCAEDCIENDILRSRTHLDVGIFRNMVLNKIRDLLPVTLLEIKTSRRTLRVYQRKGNDAGPHHPAIPDSLTHFPRLPISSLQKCPVDTDYDHIDIVTRADDLGPCQQWYVFKRYTTPLEEHERPIEDLLQEVELLCRLDSPYIIKPSFLVTDDSGSVFRGYLMPFMPAGALGHVFEGLQSGGLGREPLFLHPRHLCLCEDDEGSEEDESGDEGATRPMKWKNPQTQLPWSLKHTWAIEATSALVTLHENSIYSGDVKLGNILLDRNGHLQFIDVAPQSTLYTYEYVAPELGHHVQEFCGGNEDDEDNEVEYALTEARDIFSFGIVLWQIAEEEAGVDREDPTKAPHLIWRSYDVEGSTPQWYRDIVELCTECDPAKRPSAREILKVLEDNV